VGGSSFLWWRLRRRRRRGRSLAGFRLGRVRRKVHYELGDAEVGLEMEAEEGHNNFVPGTGFLWGSLGRLGGCGCCCGCCGVRQFYVGWFRSFEALGRHGGVSDTYWAILLTAYIPPPVNIAVLIKPMSDGKALF
jgi:hypothetical protein